jgi:hypothetical protein
MKIAPRSARPFRRVALCAAALLLAACEQDDISGEWMVTPPVADVVVGRLLIQHSPTGAANMSDHIRMDAELRGQVLKMDGAYWHGGTFAVMGRGCLAPTPSCADSVAYILGHRANQGEGIDDRFDAELVILPDTIKPGQNPIFILLDSQPTETYLATKVR